MSDGLLVWKIIEYLQDALFEDGSHHKQWYLYQIAKLIKDAGFQIDLENVDEGIAP